MLSLLAAEQELQSSRHAVAILVLHDASSVAPWPANCAPLGAAGPIGPDATAVAVHSGSQVHPPPGQKQQQQLPLGLDGCGSAAVAEARVGPSEGVVAQVLKARRQSVDLIRKLALTGPRRSTRSVLPPIPGGPLPGSTSLQRHMPACAPVAELEPPSHLEHWKPEAGVVKADGQGTMAQSQAPVPPASMTAGWPALGGTPLASDAPGSRMLRVAFANTAMLEVMGAGDRETLGALMHRHVVGSPALQPSLEAAVRCV